MQFDFPHPQIIGIKSDSQHILSSQALANNVTNLAFLEHISKVIQHIGTRSYIKNLTAYQVTGVKKKDQPTQPDTIHELPLRQAATIFNATNLLYKLLQKDFGKSRRDMIELQNMDLSLQEIKNKMTSLPFEIHDGILYKKNLHKDILVLCLPLILCKEVLNRFHSTMGFHINNCEHSLHT